MVVVPGSITGRDDAIQNAVSSTVRAPVFVDNTVLHAVYQRQRSLTTGSTITVSPPLTSDFQNVHDRTYRLIEEQDAVRLTHPNKHGTRYNKAIYFNGNKLTNNTDQYPLLIFGGVDSQQRLGPSTVQTTTYGSELVLPNMRGKSLKDIEFDEPTVRLGQTVGVGFRTTDAVQQLFLGIYHSLNSVEVGLSFAGPRAGTHTNYKGADIARHSTRFIAKDFYNIGIIEAMKYIGRHDYHTTYMDRFGNLLYAPVIFMLTGRELGDTKGVGTVKNKPMMRPTNRIISKGMTRGLNDTNTVIVDDMELQKRHGSIKASEVFSPLSRTPSQSRRTAAEGLRVNKKAQTVLVSEEHINSWDMDPGDVVMYKSPSSGIQRSVAILEATHSLREHASDFKIVRDAGIESMLSVIGFSGELIDEEVDTITQIPLIELSNTGSVNIYVKPYISVFTYSGTQTRSFSNAVSPLEEGHSIAPRPTKGITDSNPNKQAGFIIGHRYSQANTTLGIGTTYMTKSARGAIGVGASLSTKITGGGAAQYIHATKLLTVVSTVGFPATGTIMIVSQDSTLAYSAPYDAITATTFHITTSFGADKTWASNARVIYARPRGHEMRECRSRRQVVMG